MTHHPVYFLFLCHILSCIHQGQSHYPPYYRLLVNNEAALQVEMVKDLLGTFSLQPKLYRSQIPWYQQEGSKKGALFITDDGRWTIAKGLGKEQVIRSKSVSSSEPPNDRGWEIRDMNNSWNNEPSLYRAYKSVYGLKIPKYRLNTDPNLKKIQTKYGLHLTKIQT